MAEGPTEGRQKAAAIWSGRGHSYFLCSLGEPDAEVATCGTEEALKRRARQTHCERPCGNPDAMGYVQQRSRFGFVCVVTVEGHRRGR